MECRGGGLRSAVNPGEPPGWNGTQALEGLAVSKCAPATNGCAPAAPGLLTFCCNCFTMTPQNHTDAYEEPGKHVSWTAWRIGARLKTGRAMGRSTPGRRMTVDRSCGGPGGGGVAGAPTTPPRPGPRRGAPTTPRRGGAGGTPGGAWGPTPPGGVWRGSGGPGAWLGGGAPHDLPTDGGRAAVRGTRSPRRGCPPSGRRRPGRRDQNAPRRMRRPPATPLHRPSPGR